MMHCKLHQDAGPLPCAATEFGPIYYCPTCQPQTAALHDPARERSWWRRRELEEKAGCDE